MRTASDREPTDLELLFELLLRRSAEFLALVRHVAHILLACVEVVQVSPATEAPVDALNRDCAGHRDVPRGGVLACIKHPACLQPAEMPAEYALDLGGVVCHLRQPKPQVEASKEGLNPFRSRTLCVEARECILQCLAQLVQKVLAGSSFVEPIHGEELAEPAQGMQTRAQRQTESAVDVMVIAGPQCSAGVLRSS